MAQLFRKSSIERLSSPEQLDKAIVVTSPMSWTVLIGIAIIIICFTVWAFCGTMPTTLKAKGVISNGVLTDGQLEISEISEDDVFAVFYVGAEQLPGIKPGMEVVANMPSFDNQKYGHMTGSIISVGSTVETEESIMERIGTNGDVREYLGISDQPIVSVICSLNKAQESKNGLYWSNSNGEELSVKYGSFVDVTIVMDEQAPITKLIPALRQ